MSAHLSQAGPVRAAALVQRLGLICGRCNVLLQLCRASVIQHACAHASGLPLSLWMEICMHLALCIFFRGLSGHSSNALHSAELWPSEHSALVNQVGCIRK